MPNFASALSRTAEEIKRPPALPQGDYLCRVTKMPDPATKMDTKAGPMEVLRIQCEVLEAVDVDTDLLEAFGKVAGQPLRRDFMFSNEDENRFNQTLFNLKQFLIHCGIEVDESASLAEALAQLPNARFIASVTQRMDKEDPEAVYAEIKRTAPAA